MPEVQSAIHATRSLWRPCTPNHSDHFNYTESFYNMLNYYNYFFNYTDLDILIYSGDVDIADVPHVFTQECLSQLGRPIVKEWRYDNKVNIQYYILIEFSRWTVEGPELPSEIPNAAEKQKITAGYCEVYDKYTFTTVRGAGNRYPIFNL